MESPPKSGQGFTAVPHDLLRGDARFQDPLDFMVYLHLFTYSYGFGRTTASMSQAQLERFTGAAKNTIKRALDRLTREGWIQMVEDFEHARMSRRWRVFRPDERRGPGRGKRVSPPDPVQDEQNQEQPPALSNVDPPTVSSVDPYKEKGNKEKSHTPAHAHIRARELPADGVAFGGESEESLPSGLAEYLTDLKPARKRRSEWSSFHELRGDFGADEIADALVWLTEHGLPGSAESCHSPMAFLASGGIAPVLALIRSARDRRAQGDALRTQRADQLRKEQEEVQREEQEASEREAAFLRAFPRPEDQRRAVATVAAKFPGLSPEGPVLRGLAIAAWAAREREGVA